MPAVRVAPSIDPAEPIRTAFAARIGQPRYQMWFGPNAAFVWLGHELCVACRSVQFHDWVQDKFAADLGKAVEQVVGQPVPVRFVCDPELFNGPGDTSPTVTEKAEKPTGDLRPPLTKKQQHLFEVDPPLPPPPRKKPAAGPGRKWKTFTEFAVGLCNRVPHAAALAAVEEPGQGANPLVLFGPVGTGKTHLLEAIYAGLRKQWPDAAPLFVHAEDFTTRFVQASRFGKMSNFRRQYREASALLFDDLHFLETKPGTQEEFLHTLDALTHDGRQVVVTTDCHPRLADKLMPELVDRLVGGAVWGLMPPDDETRLDILRRKASGRSSPALPEDVLKFLARNLKGNARELEGAVNSVHHFAKVTARPVTTGLAREAVGELLRHTVRVVTVADIDAAVCSVLRLSAGTLQSKSRSWTVCHPRMLAVYLARKLTPATYGEIAKHFGVKQHSTAVAGEKKAREWVKTNATLALGDRKWAVTDLLDRIERELQK